MLEQGTTSGEFTTYVDARAGGTTPTQAYTYLRFTPTGLVVVAIDDFQAQTNDTWDIAMRRLAIRINSGPSGPSCVSAMKTTGGTTFEQVTSATTGTLAREQYYTPQCTMIDDGSGLGGPDFAIDYWTYSSCVKMTNTVYVVQLADSRRVKLQVLSYYDLAVQTTCDTTGTVPQPSGAGQLRVRWAFL